MRTLNFGRALPIHIAMRVRYPQAAAIILAVGGVLAMAQPDSALAHGFAGKRFFPATLVVDDPFIADELALPTATRRKTGGSNETPVTETSASVDYSKVITPEFALGFGATYLWLKPDGGTTQTGWDNFSANVKYQIYKSAEHETIVSIGADWDIGGTGTKRIGRESFSTVTPTLFFGKGMGDLPDSMRYLRPFAVTGAIGVGIPSRASKTTFDDDGNAFVEQHPTTGNLGFAIEYSVPYLQAFVKDVGLGAPFDKMIPLVEVAMAKPLNRGRGPMTGTINPGVVWAGSKVQFGIEAVVPINSKLGSKTGVLVQVHYFLDDLFPKTIGKPLFSR